MIKIYDTLFLLKWIVFILLCSESFYGKKKVIFLIAIINQPLVLIQYVHHEHPKSKLFHILGTRFLLFKNHSSTFVIILIVYICQSISDDFYTRR